MKAIATSGSLYLRQLTPVSNIEYSYDNSTWELPITSWPILISNSNTSITLNVNFTTDITISSSNTKYFVLLTTNIQFGNTSLNTNGLPTTITLDGLLGGQYIGLVSFAFGNCVLSNIKIVVTNGTVLQSGCGWFAPSSTNYGSNSVIINCSSDGDITRGGGGIIGGSISGTLQIIGCTSSGTIYEGGGGIVGANTTGASITVIECSSSGSMNTIQGGGIFGRNCSNCTAIRCYSTGYIYQGGGGIFGYQAGLLGSVIAENCYSEGEINIQAGGIFGAEATNSTATRCYSTGFINTVGGGIFGESYTSSGLAINCYTSGGLIVGQGYGIYSGQDSDNPQGSNNYSEGNNDNLGLWSDVNASPRLDTTPPTPLGTIWISVSPNTPYILRSILFSPYSINNIIQSGASYSFNTSYSQTILEGGSTIPAILPAGYTYDIVVINDTYPSAYPDISINAATGQISTTPTITPGTYQLFVRNSINPYAVSIFNLTIPGAPIVHVMNQLVIPPCCQITQCVRNSPTTNNSNQELSTYLTGKTIIGNVDRYYNSISNGTRTFFTTPVFKSYREYMIYLQSQSK
jgi:hypothetical protein